MATQAELEAQAQANAAHFAELATGFGSLVLQFNEQMLALQQSASFSPVVQVVATQTNIGLLKTLLPLYERGATRPPRGT